MSAGISEQKLETKLNNSRVARIRVRAGNPPEAAAREIRVWVVEVYLVENVEQFRAELHVYSLGDPGVLEEPHVETEQVGTVECAGSDIAECSHIVQGECGGVKPYSLVRTGRRCRADPGQLHTIPVDPGLRIVAPTENIIRSPTLVLADTRGLPPAEQRVHETAAGLNPGQVPDP